MKNINKIFKISTAFILIFIAMSCGNTSKSESKSDESQETHKEGEIGYIEYISTLEQSLTIRQNYLEFLNLYNQMVNEINFLNGKYN